MALKINKGAGFCVQGQAPKASGDVKATEARAPLVLLVLWNIGNAEDTLVETIHGSNVDWFDPT